MSFSSMAVDWEKGKKKKKSPTAFSIKLSVENPPNSFPEMSVENRAAPGSWGRLRIPASPGFQPASKNPCAVGSRGLSIAGGTPAPAALLLSKQHAEEQILPLFALPSGAGRRAACCCLGKQRGWHGGLVFKGKWLG